MKRLDYIIEREANRIGVEEAALKAFIKVESAGSGFAKDGKIKIQFEPHVFRSRAKDAPRTLWNQNKVDRQSQEWIAYNDAFRHNPNAAMESTSIGLGQVMGYHYKRLGYPDALSMWEDAKKGEDRQVWQMAEFIRTDKRLTNALRSKNWHLVATYYNGAKYREQAARLKIVPYDKQMERAYNQYK